MLFETENRSIARSPHKRVPRCDNARVHIKIVGVDIGPLMTPTSRYSVNFDDSICDSDQQLTRITVQSCLSGDFEAWEKDQGPGMNLMRITEHV